MRRWLGGGSAPPSTVASYAVLVLVGLLVGCGSGSDGAAPSTTSGDRTTTTEASAPETTTTAASAEPSPPEDTCGGIEGETAWLDVPDVGRIQMATTGSGDKVAVFLHQTNRNGMCGFRAYAERLAEQGVRSVLVNQCGYGESECEDGTEVGESWPKVAAAVVAQVRKNGAARVTLVGASAGGTLAIVAAGDDPEIDAVVNLSGPLAFSGLDAEAAAPSVTQQALVATAPGDNSGPTPAEAEALVAKMASTDKRVFVATDQEGVHGWSLLGGEERWTPLADTVQQVVLGG